LTTLGFLFDHRGKIQSALALRDMQMRAERIGGRVEIDRSSGFCAQLTTEALR
jgi:hypothetical protein